MHNLHHTFYDDNILIDLRFLVAAETWEDPDDDTVFGIGAILEVGGSAQRLSATYTTRPTAIRPLVGCWLCTRPLKPMCTHRRTTTSSLFVPLDKSAHPAVCLTDQGMCPNTPWP